MKRKVLFILFILNSLLLLFYFLPMISCLPAIFSNTDAGAIGIIGGADGPTAIFIASKYNWTPVILIAAEIALGAGLLALKRRS